MQPDLDDVVDALVAAFDPLPADEQHRVAAAYRAFDEGLFGLELEPVTPHRLRVEGHPPVWTWCAFDALFIVALLGTEAEVDSTCPVTGDPINLRLGPEGVETAEPADTVVSLLMPDGLFGANVRQEFCRYVHFFANADAAEVLLAQQRGGFWLSVVDAADVAARVATDVFPDL